MGQTLGAWPNKCLRCGADGKARNHGVILRGLYEKEGKAIARVVTHVNETHSKEREVPIEQDDKGNKYISVFGGVIFRFDDVLWFE